MGAGRGAALPAPGAHWLDYFFFLGVGALGFLYAVFTFEFIDSNMALAESANCPVGASSRYFWNASAVPATGVTLPSAANDALPIRRSEEHTSELQSLRH